MLLIIIRRLLNCNLTEERSLFRLFKSKGVFGQYFGGSQHSILRDKVIQCNLKKNLRFVLLEITRLISRMDGNHRL